MDIGGHAGCRIQFPGVYGHAASAVAIRVRDPEKGPLGIDGNGLNVAGSCEPRPGWRKGRAGHQAESSRAAIDAVEHDSLTHIGKDEKISAGMYCHVPRAVRAEL